MAQPHNSLAHAYLEDLQRAVLAARGMDITAWGSEFTKEQWVDRYIERHGRDLPHSSMVEARAKVTAAVEDALAIPRPSRFEDPMNFKLLHDLIIAIEQAAASLGRTIPQRPVFGTLRTGQVNAAVIPVPSSSQFIVAVETELFLFALLTCKAVGVTFPAKASGTDQITLTFSRTDITSNLNAHPEASHRFREVLLAYLVQGSPGSAPPYLIEESQMELPGHLIHSLELFVVGHEYGHIFADHLGSVQSTPATIAGVPIDEVMFNWFQEIDADAIGLELSLEASRLTGTPLPIAYAGAELLFSLFQVVESSLSILQTGSPTTQPSPTHPPPSDRREHLRDVITASLPSEAVEPVLEFADVVNLVVQRFREDARPHLEAAFQAGVRPSTAWL